MNTPGSKVQIGCGAGPLPGWINIDNSPSVRIARLPRASGLVESLGGALGLIGPANRAVIAAARAHGVLWGDARHLPLPDNCAAVVYSAHMLEHLPDRPLGQGGARDGAGWLAAAGAAKLPHSRPSLSERSAGFGPHLGAA
ncbi:MAG: methyltransferase domain-containing protein [Rhodospirillaceae bacterium]